MTRTERNTTAKLKRNGLIVECAFNDNGRLERKTERYGLQCAEYAYRYDAKGHLAEVRRAGALVESYHYNPKGQREVSLTPLRGFEAALRTAR